MSADNSLVDPAFEYNAPQFVDFTTPVEDDETVDEYFNYDHESGVPVIPDDFEESTEANDEDSAIYATPRQNFGNSTTPAGTRRSSRIQAKTPSDNDKTPNRQRRVSAPETPKIDPVPQRVLTPKNNNVSQPHRVLTPKTATPQAKRVFTPKETRSKRYSEPLTPKPKQITDGKPKVPSNLCTSPGEWKRKMSKQSTSSNEQVKPTNKQQKKLKEKNPSRRSVPNLHIDTSLKVQPEVQRKSRPAAAQRSKSIERTTRSMSKDRNKSLNTSLTRTTNTSARSRTRSRNASLNRSVDSSTRLRTRSSTNRETSPTKKGSVPAIKPKLTMPTTPTFMKRKAAQEHNKDLKTTEERELERIEQLRKELEAKRKLAEESYKASLTSTSYVPPQSKQPLTRPDKIQFATDERIKNVQDSKTDNKETNFTKMLRNNRLRTGTQPLKPTIPQPFHLHDRKRKVDETQTNTKYVSMAEVEKSVFGKTPDRFRSRPHNKGPSPAKKRRSSGDTGGKTELTIPKTPSLQTRSRKRDHHIISQAELDEMEFEDIKKHKFKANPVNERVLKNAHLGVKKVPPKELTKPVGFELETDKRNDVWANHKQEEPEPEPFHARPVPSAILKGPTGVKPAKEIPVTIPESPAFALRSRVRPQRKPSLPQPEDVKKLMREHKVPHTGIPFQPKIEHRITEPQPFSFESRDKRMMSEKEKKIKRALEEEKKAREFHANPLPDLSPETLPRRKAKSPTKPEPFHLEIDDRGAKKAEEWRQKMQEDLQKQREMSQFRAQPSDVVHKQPFIPKKSTKALTDVTDFELNTDRRCEERAEFEKWKKEHEQQLALQKLAAERAEREREEELYRQMRAEAKVKANPIRKYKGVQIQPSDKPLTNPVTPRFSTRIRSRTSMLNESQ